MSNPSKENTGIPANDQHDRILHLRKPFGPEKISVLKKKYKDKHGQWQEFELDYVGHADVTERLLEADPYWNWYPVAHHEDGTPKCVVNQDGNPIGLWIKLEVCGHQRLGYGSCEPGKSDAVKELIGDALRNAAMRFGVALALWSKTRENDISFDPAPAANPVPPRKPQAARTPQVSAAAVRNDPPHEEPAADFLAPSRDEDARMATEVANAFGGTVEEEPFGKSPSGPIKVLGVTVPATYTYDMATSLVLNFGKHKGKTLGSLLKNSEGKGWIEWLAEKTASELRQGKRKSYPSDFLVLVAYSSFQPTATIPGDGPSEGELAAEEAWGAER